MTEEFDKRGFHIVKASAGSGKTYRLVRDYLACCLWEKNPHYFRHILAITFTNKAAQEMKDRILNEVRNVACGEGAMYGSLCAIVPIEPEELESRANALAEAMLHRYEDFSVMTIDSFVNRLVRSFSKDLRWEEDFQIELDESALIDEAISRLLARVGRPGEESLTRLLEGFVRQQVEEERNGNFRSLLASFGKQVTKESMQKALRALDPEVWTPAALESYRKKQWKYLQEEVRKPVAHARTALIRFDELGLEAGDFYYKDLPNWLQSVAKGKGRGAKPSNRLTEQIESEKFWKSGASPEVISRIQSAFQDIFRAIDAWKLIYDGESGGIFKLKEHLQERVSLIGTMGLIRDELRAVEHEKNVRLLSTLNEEISSIVRENPAPFIYERIGNRYRNIFIDEFQDTSITQWHNLVQLFDHLVSIDEMGMVVGDVKQAIYRWRNGNYEQLEALPALIGEPGPVLKASSRALSRSQQRAKLNFNRRSGHKIVEWNNRWFQQIQSFLPDHLQRLYDDVKQEATADFAGQVCLETLVEGKAHERQEKRNAWVLERILEHTGGRLVEVDGRKQYEGPNDSAVHFAMGDVAVLLRRNRDGAVLAQYLLEYGITPWTSESLHLGRHPATLGVMALLRSMLDPDNPVHLLTFVQCYCAIHPEVSETDLLRSHHQRVTIELEGRKPIEKATMDQRSLYREVAPELRIWELSTAPITVMVGHCFDALGWGAKFPAYAEGMMELSHEMASNRHNSLKDFIHFWDRSGHKKSIHVSGGQNAVQIMTPHKAKGLDFKVVIAPVHPEKINQFKDEIPVELDADVFELPVALLRNSDLKDTPLEDERLREIDRTMLDALNVAYVTMTRAVERLDVCLEFEKEPEVNAETTTLPMLLWKGWLAAFSAAEDASTMRFGSSDRRQEARGTSFDGTETVIPQLLVGQMFEQKIARPKRHWSENAASRDWTPSQFGNAVHSVLSQLRNKRDWDSLRQRLNDLEKWSEGNRKRVTDAIDQLLAQEAVAKFFDADVADAFAERSLHVGRGKVERPDRVVRIGEEWHVIDFKTGKPLDKHAAQVSNYASALQAALPGQRITAWLIYTSDGTLVHVPVLFNDA